jgi:hypothetical protein
MARVQITYKIAMAAGQDAGNKSMHAAGRTAWNEDDWNRAAEVTARLLSTLSPMNS